MSLLNKPLFRLFLIFLIVYAVFARFDGWPENSRLDLTRAIVDEGRFEIDTYANNTGDRAYYNGHYYSDKFPGGSFIAIPPYFVFKYIFGMPEPHNSLYEDTVDPVYNFMLFFIILSTSSLLTALTVVLVYKTAGFFTEKRSHQYIAAIAYGGGTIAFNYATLFYDHAISTFFSFLAFYIIYSSLERNNLSALRFMLAGASIGFAVITTPSTGVILFGLIFYLIFKKRYIQVSYFFIASLLIISIFFFYNFSIFKTYQLPYAHLDEEIFTYKPFFIEDSECLENDYSENFFEQASAILPFLDSKRAFCIYNIEIRFSPSSVFPLLENNSGGPSFILTSVKNNTYFFTRNYLLNKRLMPFFFKYDVFDSHIDVFFRKNEEPYWTIIYKVLINDSGVEIINYERGAIRKSDCPLNKTMYNNYFVCNETITTFSGIVLRETSEEFMLLNISMHNKTTIKKFEVTRHPIYSRNGFLIKAVKLVFYPYRGLLWYSPILVFSFFGFFPMFKKRAFEAFLVIFIFLSFLFFQASLYFWWGGTAFGPRHLMPVIPFLFLPFIFALKKVNIRTVVLILILSALVNLAGMQSLEHQGVSTISGVSYESDVWDSTFSWKPIGNPLFEHYLPLFVTRGPNSMVLERILDIDFPSFLNVLFLFFLSFILLFFYFKKKKR